MSVKIQFYFIDFVDQDFLIDSYFREVFQRTSRNEFNSPGLDACLIAQPRKSFWFTM